MVKVTEMIVDVANWEEKVNWFSPYFENILGI